MEFDAHRRNGQDDQALPDEQEQRSEVVKHFDEQIPGESQVGLPTRDGQVAEV